MEQTLQLQPEEPNPIAYNVDKMTFHVTPVHKPRDTKTIHDIILDLIKCEK